MAQDANFLPWQRAEKPTAKTLLQERLEGQQISQLYYLDSAGPTGSRGIAFELTTGAKLLIFAGRVRERQFSARLFFRYLPRPLIVLPRMERLFSGGRSRNPLADPPDELQKYVEGEVVCGISPLQPSAQGGDRIEIEFRGGRCLYLEAEPIEHLSLGLLADIKYVFTTPDQPITMAI